MSPAKMSPVQRFAYRVFRTMVKDICRPEAEAIEICRERSKDIAHAHAHGRDPRRYAWTLFNTWSQDQQLR